MTGPNNPRRDRDRYKVVIIKAKGPSKNTPRPCPPKLRAWIEARYGKRPDGESTGTDSGNNGSGDQ